MPEVYLEAWGQPSDFLAHLRQATEISTGSTELTGSAGSSSYTAPAPRQESYWLELGWKDIAAIKACPVGVNTEEQQKMHCARPAVNLRSDFPAGCTWLGPFLGESYTVDWFVSWSCWQDIRECVCLCLIVASVDSHPQLLNFLSSYDFIQYVTICEAQFNLRHFHVFV